MKFILILLFVFTPIAFGSMEIWAFSLMELGILLLIILWSIQNLMRNAECGMRNFRYEIIFISIFLVLDSFSNDSSSSRNSEDTLS